MYYSTKKPTILLERRLRFNCTWTATVLLLEYSRFSLDVTKIQTKELPILMSV